MSAMAKVAESRRSLTTVAPTRPAPVLVICDVTDVVERLYTPVTTEQGQGLSLSCPVQVTLSAPPVLLQVYGGATPEAVSVAVYVTRTIPAGRKVVSMLSRLGANLSPHCAVSTGNGPGGLGTAPRRGPMPMGSRCQGRRRG